MSLAPATQGGPGSTFGPTKAPSAMANITRVGLTGDAARLYEDIVDLPHFLILAISTLFLLLQ